VRNYWLYEHISDAWVTKNVKSLRWKLIEALWAKSLVEHHKIFEYDYMSCTIAQCSWMCGFIQAAGDLWVDLKYSTKDRREIVEDFCVNQEERERLYQYSLKSPHFKGTLVAVGLLRKALNRKLEI
jgi:hypothetical protein